MTNLEFAKNQAAAGYDARHPKETQDGISRANEFARLNPGHTFSHIAGLIVMDNDIVIAASAITGEWVRFF